MLGWPGTSPPCRRRWRFFPGVNAAQGTYFASDDANHGMEHGGLKRLEQRCRDWWTSDTQHGPGFERSRNDGEISAEEINIVQGRRSIRGETWGHRCKVMQQATTLRWQGLVLGVNKRAGAKAASCGSLGCHFVQGLLAVCCMVGSCAGVKWKLHGGIGGLSCSSQAMPFFFCNRSCPQA